MKILIITLFTIAMIGLNASFLLLGYGLMELAQRVV